jgi:predicted component of type VI protein secretion system
VSLKKVAACFVALVILSGCSASTPSEKVSYSPVDFNPVNHLKESADAAIIEQYGKLISDAKLSDLAKE